MWCCSINFSAEKELYSHLTDGSSFITWHWLYIRMSPQRRACRGIERSVGHFSTTAFNQLSSVGIKRLVTSGISLHQSFVSSKKTAKPIPQFNCSCATGFSLARSLYLTGLCSLCSPTIMSVSVVLPYTIMNPLLIGKMLRIAAWNQCGIETCSYELVMVKSV